MEPEDLLKALSSGSCWRNGIKRSINACSGRQLGANRATTERDVNQLTPRERDILKLIAQWFAEQDDCPPPGHHRKHSKSARQAHAEENEAKSRVEAAVWVHQERIF